MVTDLTFTLQQKESIWINDSFYIFLIHNITIVIIIFLEFILNFLYFLYFLFNFNEVICMSDENQNKVYNLLISKGIDSYNEYDFYKERINSQKEFKWNEYNTQDDELNDELFEKIDVIVLLYGLYHKNEEICDELIDKSQEYDIPLLFVRSFGVEYVVEEIVEMADAVVGWNPHCIIDAIQTLVKGEGEWIKPCDIEEES